MLLFCIIKRYAKLLRIFFYRSITIIFCQLHQQWRRKWVLLKILPTLGATNSTSCHTSSTQMRKILDRQSGLPFCGEYSQ